MNVREHLIKIDVGRWSATSVRPERCGVEAVGLNDSFDCVVYQLRLALRTKEPALSNTPLISSLSVPPKHLGVRCAGPPTG